MATPFVGQLLLVPFNFPPKGYAFCDGQLLSISQNTALFSLLGTFYGGDGKSNFALPNLQGSIPIGLGQGPGLQDHVIGESAGSDSITLLTSEMPQHSHSLMADATPGNSTSPAADAPSRLTGGGTPYAPGASPLNQTMSANSLAPAGGDQPHNNLMPYLTLNWVIALQGVYPPRT
jgi:microcystin-dependent protein